MKVAAHQDLDRAIWPQSLSLASRHALRRREDQWIRHLAGWRRSCGGSLQGCASLTEQQRIAFASSSASQDLGGDPRRERRGVSDVNYRRDTPEIDHARERRPRHESSRASSQRAHCDALRGCCAARRPPSPSECRTSTRTSRFRPTMRSRWMTGTRSIWFSGRMAGRPTSTSNPPVVTRVTPAVSAVPFSNADEIRSQASLRPSRIGAPSSWSSADAAGTMVG